MESTGDTVVIAVSANLALANMNARNLGKVGDDKCDVCARKPY